MGGVISTVVGKVDVLDNENEVNVNNKSEMDVEYKVDEVHVVDTVAEVDVIDKVGEVDVVEKVCEVDEVDKVDELDVVDSVSEVDVEYKEAEACVVDMVAEVDIIDKVGELDVVDSVSEVDAVEKVGENYNVAEVDEAETVDKVAEVEQVGEVDVDVVGEVEEVCKMGENCKVDEVDVVGEVDVVAEVDEVCKVDEVVVVAEVDEVDCMVRSASVSRVGPYERAMPGLLKLDSYLVVPRTQVWVGSLSSGASDVIFTCTPEKILTVELQDELGDLIYQLCKILPGGVLCFLPSHHLLHTLKLQWQHTGTLTKIALHKHVLIEPRDKGGQTFHQVLCEYYEAVNSGRGALLLVVYGGNVCQDVDFSDGHVRGVVTVGMPSLDVEDGRVLTSCEVYRVLNQALSKVISHTDDWGSVVLIDSRFAEGHQYTSRLRKWVRDKLVTFRKGMPGYGRGLRSLHSFNRTIQWYPPPHTTDRYPYVKLPPVDLVKLKNMPERPRLKRKHEYCQNMLPQLASNALCGAEVCFTGEFECGSRRDLVEYLTDIGAVVVDRLTHETDFLIKGINHSERKLRMSEKQAIRILDEDEFLKFLSRFTAVNHKRKREADEFHEDQRKKQKKR